MTLSIIDSMLRGDLRRQILPTLKTEKEISLLWRDLLKATTQGEHSLMAIENALVAAVEMSGLVKVSSDYKDDRDLRQGAEQARNAGICFVEDCYTRVTEKLNLEGVFPQPQETTPTDKFLHLLVKTECRRTMECLLMLANAVRDDSVVRTYIRKLFSSVTSLCMDAKEAHIKESLTQFYFEVYYTFRCVLLKSPQQRYETDFENFVFEWKGEFPNGEITERFNAMTQGFTPTSLKSPYCTDTPELHDQTPPVKAEIKDKFDLFLEAANRFTFIEMPKVKELGTPQKIRQLVECLLQEKKTVAETFGHIAAMLDFLGFYKWIANNHVSGYTFEQYDKWCSKYIMNKASGTAFRHYRLSVNVDHFDSSNASYKYLGWRYKDSVKEEYNKILES